MAYCITTDMNIELFQSLLSEQLQSLLLSSIQEVIAAGYPYWSVDAGTTVEYEADGMGIVGYKVSTDNARAFVLEFGSGEFMDESNPYLSEYKRSVYWNKPFRTGPSIVTRPEGEYQSFNWETGRPEIKEASGVMPPGFKTKFQGEAPNPQISKMLNHVKQVFLDKVRNDAAPLIRSVIEMRGNRIFTESKSVY